MSKTLLLADDSVVIQKLIGLSLAKEKFEIVITDNGDDAVAKAREIRPDIVLADIVMPGKSGYEVCESIKQDPALAEIPVLLLSGTFEALDEARALAAGADGLINKPFEAHVLVDRIHELLNASPERFDTTEPENQPNQDEVGAPPVDFRTPNTGRTIEPEPNFINTNQPPAPAEAGEFFSPLIEVPESHFFDNADPKSSTTTSRKLDPICLNQDLELETPVPITGKTRQTSDSSPIMEKRIQDMIEKVAQKAFAELSETLVEEMTVLVEEIAREVIGPLAQTLVKEEIRNRKDAGE